MEQKELILRLIEDDLINTYLIDSLERIEFYSEYYRLNLSDTLFKLIGIDNDEMYEAYLIKCGIIAKQDIIKNKMLLEKGVKEIYEFLCD